jgi:hypoxanthine-DNA glycosylase
MMETAKYACRSFPPLLGANPRVLVLGSMPGDASLSVGQYYAHPRNAFWFIMGDLVGAGPDLTYEERVIRLTHAGIALWDVLAFCERPGSLDTAIDPNSEQPNSVDRLLAGHPSIAAVYLNGGKPMAAFRRHILRRLDASRVASLRIRQLPSTSPTNARMTLGEKSAAWRCILDSL